MSLCKNDKDFCFVAFLKISVSVVVFSLYNDPFVQRPFYIEPYLGGIDIFYIILKDAEDNLYLSVVHQTKSNYG